MIKLEHIYKSFKLSLLVRQTNRFQQTTVKSPVRKQSYLDIHTTLTAEHVVGGMRDKRWQNWELSWHTLTVVYPICD